MITQKQRDMKTARITDYQIVEIIKKSNKTSLVKDLTSDNNEIYRVKNMQLEEDEFIPLNEETAKTTSLILNINNPQWGVKKFNYKLDCYTYGTGVNQALLTSNEMKCWRVIK